MARAADGIVALRLALLNDEWDTNASLPPSLPDVIGYETLP